MEPEVSSYNQLRMEMRQAFNNVVQHAPALRERPASVDEKPLLDASRMVHAFIRRNKHATAEEFHFQAQEVLRTVDPAADAMAVLRSYLALEGLKTAAKEHGYYDIKWPSAKKLTDKLGI